MTYVLAALVCLSIVALMICVWVCINAVTGVVAQSAEERRALEDRILALTDRDASVLVSAQENASPASVTYVDEREEARLSPSVGVGYPDDD